MSSASLPAPNASLHRTLWLLLALVILVMVGLFVRQSWKTMMDAAVVVLPSYNYVAPFSLTERSGRTITEKDLLGKVWVADFFFTTCPGPCPIMSEKLELLQQALNKTDKVRIVSFSVDPAHDTPQVLQTYAQRYGADPVKWLFLTGSEETITDLMRNTFKLPRTPNPDADVFKFGRYVHSTRFVLVDSKGMIRGFYDSLAIENEQHLLQDIGYVMREEGL